MDNYAYSPEEYNGRAAGDHINGRPFAIARHNNAQVAPNDYLVVARNREKPAEYYKRLSIIFFVLAVIFLIGLIVLLILNIKRANTEICTSDECLRTATNLKYSIDFSKDPCDNFYEYCCGKWSEEHPNHGWYTSFSTFSTISEKILIDTVNMLTSDPEDGEPKAVNLARNFYKSCMDRDALDQLGLNDLYKYLQMTGLPVVPTMFSANVDGNSFSFDWLKVEAYVKQIFAMDVFFGFLVDSNYFNRSENVIFLGVPYQKCPLPTPLKRKKLRPIVANNKKGRSQIDNDDDDDNDDDEKKDSLRKQIRARIFTFTVKEIMKNTSMAIPEEKMFRQAGDIINTMTDYIDELSDNCTLPEGVSDQEQNIALNFTYLQEITDAFLPEPFPDLWINYINYIFENTNVTIDPKTDAIYITKVEEPYLLNIVKFLTETPQLHIELYLWWVTVHAMIISTSSDIVDSISKMTSVFYEETSEYEDSIFVRSRSLDCAELVTDYMGWAVSYAIADKSFTNNTKPKVENMISDIKQAFIQHVKTLEWIDEETKKATLEKIKEMMSFVGYPEWLFQEGALDEFYNGLEIQPDAYLGNMMNMVMQYENKTLTSLRLVHKRDWSTEPISVNAFNSFLDNAINVPMGILKYPMYNLGLEVLNYGSIGTILGHELTHGFDNIGRRHDKYGNYVQWWSNQTINTFENLTECFVMQYENFTIENVEGHVKGKATLGENLADNGGLNQAFTAYKNYVQKHGEEPKLPGFENFTNFQLFFVAFGSLWCETINTEDLKNQLEYDHHCPNSIRVLGTLQNSDDFAKTFNCPKGSHMNPDRRKCTIW